MALKPITVQKSLDERLAEYSCIFSESGKTISAPEVHNVWSDFVELTLKSGGWWALWKIPRATCEDLNIDFPTIVVVKIEELNCRELKAFVTIVSAQNDLDLPEQHEALLIHLHPSEQQEDHSLYMQDIARCLDTLRFFYYHIWQSWDEEDDKCQDWASNRLEPRMKLFRDMQAGMLDSCTVSHIKNLLEEARSVHKHKSFLEMKNQNLLSKSSLKDECSDDTLEKDTALELMELQQKWVQIRQEIEMMENPFLREKEVERLRKGQITCSPDTEQYFVVWNGGSIEEHLDLMNKAYCSVPETARIMPCSLKTALNLVEGNDTIFLCPGIHKLNGENILMRNGTIKGFPSASEVTLTSQDRCAVLVEWRGATLNFSDLLLTASVTQALVVVNSGIVKAKNCQFICDTPNSSTTGVCIMPGGVTEFIDCDLSGYDAALAVHAGAIVSLLRCKITSCAIGIQVYDGAEVYMKECLIQNCSEYGIVLRTVQVDLEDTVGSFELFDGCRTIVIEDSKMQGNTHGDVLVTPMPSIYLGDIDRESEESPDPVF